MPFKSLGPLRKKNEHPSKTHPMRHPGHFSPPVVPADQDLKDLCRACHSIRAIWKRNRADEAAGKTRWQAGRCKSVPLTEIFPFKNSDTATAIPIAAPPYATISSTGGIELHSGQRIL